MVVSFKVSCAFWVVGSKVGCVPMWPLKGRKSPTMRCGKWVRVTYQSKGGGGRGAGVLYMLWWLKGWGWARCGAGVLYMLWWLKGCSGGGGREEWLFYFIFFK
ncbi:unnamed protein product [Amaranthus hypochondriacus]